MVLTRKSINEINYSAHSCSGIHRTPCNKVSDILRKHINENSSELVTENNFTMVRDCFKKICRVKHNEFD